LTAKEVELKREKCGNDLSTLDAVSEILKIGLSANVHDKIGLDNKLPTSLGM